MPLIHCMNNISKQGTDTLPRGYELTDELDGAQGVLVRSAKLHDVTFPESLLAIARAGAGVNNIPLDRCAEEGIVVFNTPGANANAVKELVICALLLGSRGILDGARWVSDHAADPDLAKAVEKAKKAFAGREIKGKKLGVIGLGAIGALVANAAVDLGMEVHGYDPYVSVHAAWRLSAAVQHASDLDKLCAECDYLTIHVPAMESTKNMIGADQIAAMKDGAVLLNFSRDTLVDTAAIVAALDGATLGSYITDFATPELMKATRNLIVLPHLGASTAEAEENCAVMAVRQLVDYLDNGNIANSVNYPACDMGPAPETGGRIAVLHRNVPGMITAMTDGLGKAGVNVDNITSKSRGSFAYALIDTDKALSDDVVSAICAADGIVRVRKVK